MNDIYKNIEDYNTNKKRKILIVFDEMIANMLNNKKLNPIITELFSCFYYTIFFAVPKNIRVKIPNKRELRQIAFNHSSHIDFQDFMNLYKKCIEKLFGY